MIIKKVFDHQFSGIRFFSDCKIWLRNNLGPDISKSDGIRPESIYIERCWSDRDEWSKLVTTYRALTGDHDLCDSITIDYGIGWSLISTTCYSVASKAGVNKAEYKYFVVIDDDTIAVQFKLSVM
jgi:hypothetical protein